MSEGLRATDGKFLMILVGDRKGSWRQVNGSVQVDHGKVMDIDVEAAEAALWLDMLTAVKTAVMLKYPPPVAAMRPTPTLSRAIPPSGCPHCGCRVFHQPYGFSSVIECNQCAAQMQQGGAAEPASAASGEDKAAVVFSALFEGAKGTAVPGEEFRRLMTDLLRRVANEKAIPAPVPETLQESEKGLQQPS